MANAIETRARLIHALTPRFAPISRRPLTPEAAFDIGRDHGTNSHARAMRQAHNALTTGAHMLRKDQPESPHYSTEHNARIQRARDARRCTCGHLNVSHGYGGDDGPMWPDGSRIGRGPCGIDRDTRNNATGWTGDPCPCEVFTDDDTPKEGQP